MKRYDSYKDSGVEWMNKIPSNWEKSRIRMVGDLYGGLTGKKEVILMMRITLQTNHLFHSLIFSTTPISQKTIFNM